MFIMPINTEQPMPLVPLSSLHLLDEMPVMLFSYRSCYDTEA